jgi:triosephosphate isomerase
VIRDKMTIPEGATSDKYKTTFIYEKDGLKKEFTLGNYPADDTAWKFVEQKSVLVSKGFVPEIHDFSVTSMEKTDLTDSILSNPGYTMLMVSRKLEKAGKNRLARGFETGIKCKNEGIDFYVLTASGSDLISGYKNDVRICQTDETTLKTMVRSNPGYILLRNGTIIGKWSWAKLPDDLSQLKNISTN